MKLNPNLEHRNRPRCAPANKNKKREKKSKNSREVGVAFIINQLKKRVGQ